MVKNLREADHVLLLVQYVPAFKHARILYFIYFHHNFEFSIVNRSWLAPGLLSYCPHLSTELVFITEILNQHIKSHCFPNTEI